MKIKVVVFALVMTASMGVQGVSFDTGLSLLKSCEADPDTSGTFFEQGFCAGYCGLKPHGVYGASGGASSKAES
jgi:hypothetical protein